MKIKINKIDRLLIVSTEDDPSIQMLFHLWGTIFTLSRASNYLRPIG